MKRRFVFACLLCSLVPVLPAGADAPPGRYTVSNGTVYDTRTQLTWQQSVGAGMGAQGDAVGFCARLTLAGGGWRLPKISELLTIADRTKWYPAIDPIAFPSTPLGFFWSSSPYVGPSPVVGSSGSVWAVNFAYGYSSNYDTSTTFFHVRCVR